MADPNPYGPHIDRREMFKYIPGFIGMERILEGRKDTGTLPMQIQMIKNLWEISKKAGCLMYFHAPVARFLDDEEIWTNSLPMLITGMTDNYAIIQWTDEIGLLNLDLKYMELNKIIFNKLPEVINYSGDYCMMVETFRLQLKKFKFTWEYPPD